MAEDFINSFIEYTSGYESPTSFWKWSAYTAIAAALRDNVWRNFGDIHICPNIFVLLLASSAVHRKGNPVKQCELFVSKLKTTKVLSGRASIQAILDDLARGETNPNTGKLIAGGSALFSAPELSAGLVNDPEAIKILTDIYDFKDEYTSRLRGTGLFRIKNLCFTMLAASNEDLLRDVYDTRAIFGGLLGRTFLIKPDEFRPGNSLFNVNHTNCLEPLQAYLDKIANLRGECRFDSDAMSEYNSWYHPFRDSYREKPDKSGISGRIHTGIIKISMILAINETLELCVQKRHVQQAINECISLLPNYRDFTMGTGTSSLMAAGTIVLNAIYEEPDRRIMRKKLLFQHWNHLDSETLDKIIITFEQAGLIHTHMSTDGVAYSLTEKCIKELYEESTKSKKANE